MSMQNILETITLAILFILKIRDLHEDAEE